jgi:putative hydrolase of the HAD superfamily
MERYTTCSNFCYVADNPSKDFVAPNALDWISICLKGDQNNIHSQDKNSIKEEHLPHYWVNNLSEINIC